MKKTLVIGLWICVFVLLSMPLAALDQGLDSQKQAPSSLDDEDDAYDEDEENKEAPKAKKAVKAKKKNKKAKKAKRAKKKQKATE